MPPLGLSVEQKSEMKVILLYCVHYTIYCFCAKIYVGYTFIQAGGKYKQYRTKFCSCFTILSIYY